jgi:hypothetical protein
MKNVVVIFANYQLIAGHLYKMGANNLLRRCVLEHERLRILVESREGIAGGHYASKYTMHKVLHIRLWWPIIHKYAKEYFHKVLKRNPPADKWILSRSLDS